MDAEAAADRDGGGVLVGDGDGGKDGGGYLSGGSDNEIFWRTRKKNKQKQEAADEC